MESYIGEIRQFAFDFAPKNWAFCDGQELSIASNQALYTIIGTTYGGNGTTTFKLPDLRGRTPIHSNNGQGGGAPLGQSAGAETTTLSLNQIPTHSHFLLAAESSATATSPTGNLLGIPAAQNLYSPTISATPLASAATGGAGQSFDRRQPYLTVQFCICVAGIYPPRD